MSENGGEQAAVFSIVLPPKPANEGQHGEHEEDREGTSLVPDDHYMKPGIDEVAEIKAPRCAPQNAAPEIFLEERVDEGEVGDEAEPCVLIQSDLRELRAEVVCNVKEIAQEI